MLIRLLPVDDGAEEEGGGDEELGDQAAAAAGHGRRLPESIGREHRVVLSQFIYQDT